MSVTITAKQVNELRQMTGAGMMDCKKALVESEGDIEKAIEILRKKGQKVASKRADRDAKEGKIVAKVTPDGKFGAMIMLNCETDFVANTPDFIRISNAIADLAVENRVKTMDELLKLKMGDRTVEEAIVENTGKTGEKNTLAHLCTIEGELVSAYNHLGNRVATLVALNKSGEKMTQAGHEIAMQIAAMAPVSVDAKSVPQEVIDRELEIARDQIRQEGKPENMVENIAKGKLQKFFKENTLYNQEFVRDSKMTVLQYIKSIDANMEVLGFYRLILGE